MIDRLIGWMVAYAELGIKFIASHIFSIEGIIALLFGIFFLGLVSRINS